LAKLANLAPRFRERLGRISQQPTTISCRPIAPIRQCYQLATTPDDRNP
jgi:hypothetical protein